MERELSEYRRTGRRRRPVIITAFILLTVICLLLILGAAAGKPIRSLAAEAVRRRGSELMTQAIASALDGASREGMSALQTDSSGNSFLYIDAARLNREAANIGMEAQRLMRECGRMGAEAQIGSITGLTLLAGRGGSVRVYFSPYGTVEPSLRTHFTSAGINQTRLEVMLTLTCTVQFVLAGRAEQAELSQTAVIYETVIVGNVPQAYTNIDSVDDALNLLPETD